MDRPLSIAAFLIGLSPALGFAAEVFVPPPPKEGYSYPECKCSNRGEMVPMGGVACLTVDGKSFLARCEMSLNNPTWRRVQDGCPSASAPSVDDPVKLL